MSQGIRSKGLKEFRRKRTAHACEECRMRKSRCDGGQPVCDKCSAMGFICRYSPPKRSSKSSKPSTRNISDDCNSWLAGRLDNMEYLLEKLVSKQDAKMSPCLPNSPPDTYSVQNIQASDDVDGMGCMTFPDENDADHFGPTSNTSFLQHIITAIKNLQLSSSAQPSFGNETTLSQSEWPSPNTTMAKKPASSGAGKLPTYGSTAKLLHRYFQYTGDMFPYLHKNTILSYLDQGHQPPLEDLQPVQRCLISTCLAFASVHGTPNKNRESDMQNGRKYFQIARSTFPEVLSKRSDVETVQALLLALQYSQGTQHSSETWGLLGAIVQRAFQIGLYRPVPSSGMTPLEMGIRTRTWWMVFMMDKMCSMTFGRPPLVPNNYMQSSLPSAVTFGLGQTVYGLSESTPTNLAGSDLFLQTCKLNLILGDIIEAIYGCNIENSPPASLLELQQEIIRIEGRLSEWKNQLPSSFQLLDALETEIIQPTGNSLRERRTVVVLSLRYLNLRSLLHRATVYRLLDSPPGRQDCREFHSLHSSIDFCIESAVISIKIISQAVKRRDVLPIWWFSAYYTLTASLTIFAAITLLVKEPTHLQRYTIQELLAMLQTALDSLDSLEQDSLVVYRCQQALKRIIHTCWAVASQYLPDDSSTGSFNEQKIVQENQPDGILGSADSLPEEFPQAYAPFTAGYPWIDGQVDLDFSWVNALAENLQVFNGDF